MCLVSQSQQSPEGTQNSVSDLKGIRKTWLCFSFLGPPARLRGAEVAGTRRCNLGVFRE